MSVSMPYTNPSNVTAHDGITHRQGELQGQTTQVQIPVAISSNLISASGASDIVSATSNLVKTRPETFTLQEAIRLGQPHLPALRLKTLSISKPTNTNLVRVIQPHDPSTKTQTPGPPCQYQSAMQTDKRLETIANLKLETISKPTNSNLGTAVQPHDPSTKTQIPVIFCQNPAARQAFKIILSAAPALVAAPGAKPTLSCPTNISSVINKSDGAGTSQQLVLTNAMKQQVVQSALQNQHASSETLQKLLFIKQLQQQQLLKQLETKTVHQPLENQYVPSTILRKLLSIKQLQQQQIHKQLEERSKANPTLIRIPKPSSSGLIKNKKTKVLRPELSEDCKREMACQALLKDLVKIVVQQGKDFQQKQKMEEMAQKRKTRAFAAKLRVHLVRHSEFLRTEILKKKTLMEREIKKMLMTEIEMQKSSCSLPVLEGIHNPRVSSDHPSLSSTEQMNKLKKGVEKKRFEHKVSNVSPVQKIPWSQQTTRNKILKQIKLLKTESDPYENSLSLDTMKIKVATCEGEIEPEFQSQITPLFASKPCKAFIKGDKNCVCSCPFNDNPSSSSHDLAPCFSISDFEKLLCVIKYLDEHAYKDEFVAAERYYAFRLRSIVRTQQMLARKLINEVLAEAEKGNLNIDVSLSREAPSSDAYDFESDIQAHAMQNVSKDISTENRKAEDNLQLPELGYLYPSKNKVLDKMQENLLKCMKQDHLVEPYAPRLRSLSSVQYSFAAKLINDILSQADFGLLTVSSELQLTYVKKKFGGKKNSSPVLTYHKKSLRSMRGIIKRKARVKKL